MSRLIRVTGFYITANSWCKNISYSHKSNATTNCLLFFFRQLISDDKILSKILKLVNLKKKIHHLSLNQIKAERKQEIF